MLIRDPHAYYPRRGPSCFTVIMLMVVGGIGTFMFSNYQTIYDAVVPEPVPTVTQSPANYAIRAKLFDRDGEIENAIKAWQDAIAIDDENPRYYQSLIELLVENGQAERGLTLAETALESTPNDDGLLQAKASAHLAYGDLLGAHGKSSQQQYIYAVEAGRDATQANPENARGYAYMAGGFIRQGNTEWGFAAEPAEIGLDFAPDDPIVLYHAAETVRVLGNPSLAREYLEYAIELKPDYVDAYLELSGVYRFNLGLPTQAVVIAEEALKYGECNAILLDRIAFYYIQSGAFPSAEENARKATKCDPDLIRAKAKLGHALFKQNNYQNAIEQLKLAVDQYGTATADNALYFGMLGLAYVYEDESQCNIALPLFTAAIDAANADSAADLTAVEGFRLCRQVQINQPIIEIETEDSP